MLLPVSLVRPPAPTPTRAAVRPHTGIRGDARADGPPTGGSPALVEKRPAVTVGSRSRSAVHPAALQRIATRRGLQRSTRRRRSTAAFAPVRPWAAGPRLPVSTDVRGCVSRESSLLKQPAPHRMRSAQARACECVRVRACERASSSHVQARPHARTRKHAPNLTPNGQRATDRPQQSDPSSAGADGQ